MTLWLQQDDSVNTTAIFVFWCHSSSMFVPSLTDLILEIQDYVLSLYYYYFYYLFNLQTGNSIHTYQIRLHI